MAAPSYRMPGTPAVFPDWSPYRDLEAACGAYLRDPDVALEALRSVLTGDDFGFTLERFVNEDNGVWQEVAVCDGDRLVLWHGEDVPPEEGPDALSGAGSKPRGGSGGGLGGGAMTSSLRVVPLSSVTEVGCRRRLVRNPSGQTEVESIDVYLLLTSLDEPAGAEGHPPPTHLPDPLHPARPIRHDALRFGKTVADGGPGQIARVEEFARVIASRVGRLR